jgi:hypothetical protein
VKNEDMETEETANEFSLLSSDGSSIGKDPSVAHMFGSHSIPFSLAIGETKLEILSEKEYLSYHRSSPRGDYQTMLISRQKRVHLSPVEPVNIPKMLSPHLLVEFTAPLTVEPKAKRDVYLTFPLEIGLFVKGGDEPQCIDIVSLTHEKYTLYGPAKGGTLCRYWRSEPKSSLSSVDSVTEGVLRLAVSNPTSGWVKLHHVVFDAALMKIFYDSRKVAAGAILRITGSETGETSFVEQPMEKGMQKAIELFTSRKIVGVPKHFVMSEGL